MNKSVALFWNPQHSFDTWGTNTVIYSGQKKTGKMDHLFECPSNSFYIFKKHNKRGWEFVGKAVSNRRIQDRIRDSQQGIYVAPRWEMTFDPSCHFADTITQVIAIYHTNAPKHDTYLTKNVLLHTLLGARPVSKALLGTGIVPFHLI